MRAQKAIAGIAAIGLGSIALMSSAGPATAAGQDGIIDWNHEFVFYYNSYWAGSLCDFGTAKSNLAGYKFLTSGAGQNMDVKNNSASVWNTRTLQYGWVFFNSNYAGYNDLVPENSKVQLTNTYNQNASFKWH